MTPKKGKRKEMKKNVVSWTEMVMSDGVFSKGRDSVYGLPFKWCFCFPWMSVSQCVYYCKVRIIWDIICVQSAFAVHKRPNTFHCVVCVSKLVTLFEPVYLFVCRSKHSSGRKYVVCILRFRLNTQFVPIRYTIDFSIVLPYNWYNVHGYFPKKKFV